MATIIAAVIGLPFVLVGLVFAFAGRDIHHKLVTIFGFTIGFTTAILGFSFLLAEAAASDAWVQFVARLAFVLVIATLFGYVGIYWTWFVYRFIIQFPGAVTGAFLAVLILGPIEGFDWLFIVGAFVLGGHIAWRLHEIFLAINTAWIGSLLVGVGIAWTRLPTLPIVREPSQLLTNPLGVVTATVALIELTAVVVVVVFVSGLAVQWSDISVLGICSTTLRSLPGFPRERMAPSRQSATEENDSRTVQKSRTTRESVAPSSDPDDESGFYEK